jgi:uncharacterized protein (DUF58 family)
MALVAAVASCAIGRAFGLIEMYVLGAGIAIAVLLAFLSLRRPLPRLQIRRVLQPSTVAVGQAARVDFQLRNVGRRHSPYMRLWEPVGAQGGAPMQVASLPAGEAASAAYRVPTTKRGQLTIGPLQARYHDVLGFCSRSTVLAGADEILIIPEYVSLPFPSKGASGRLGQHLRMKAFGQTGTEFHSLREYVIGDDLRRINWKASARSTNLMVRETALDGVRRCTVVFETNADDYDAEMFEVAVSVAASITTSAAAAGVATRLLTPEADLRGPDVAYSALRWLATVQPTRSSIDAPSISSGPTDGLGLLVIVSADIGNVATAMRSVVNTDETIIPIGVGNSTTTERFGLQVHSLADLTQSWSHLVDGIAR